MDDAFHPQVDLEALVQDEPEDHKTMLRIWLRMLSCTNLVSGELRRRLRAEFGVTLPQFDMLAQLAREPAGLRLGELSKRMMVTNSNVTGLADRLVMDGLIRRELAAGDRRAVTVSLTEAGEALFARIAARHETWLEGLFSGVDPKLATTLMRALTRLKTSVQDDIRAATPS